MNSGGLEHRLGQGIVLVNEGGFGLGIEFLHGLNGAGQVQIGRRIHLEQILVAQLVSLFLRGAGGQHDSSVLLGNDCRSCHQARGVRAEEELRFVLVYNAGVELLYARIRGLIVVADETNLVLLAASRDTAFGVYFVAPQLEAAHLRDRLVIKLARTRHRKADGQGVVGCAGV